MSANVDPGRAALLAKAAAEQRIADSSGKLLRMSADKTIADQGELVRQTRSRSQSAAGHRQPMSAPSHLSCNRERPRVPFTSTQQTYDTALSQQLSQSQTVAADSQLPRLPPSKAYRPSFSCRVHQFHGRTPPSIPRRLRQHHRFRRGRRWKQSP